MRETAVDSDLNYLLLILTSKLAKDYSIGHDELSVPTLAKEPESRPRWRKTRVEEPQSQVRADTRTIEQTAKTDALGAPTPQPFPDCVSEGEETDHFLHVLSIQAMTRREVRTAYHGES